MQKMNKQHGMKQLAHKATTFIKADEKLCMAAYTKESQMSHRQNAPNYCLELKSYSLARKLSSTVMTKWTLIIIFRGLIKVCYPNKVQIVNHTNIFRALLTFVYGIKRHSIVYISIYCRNTAELYS